MQKPTGLDVTDVQRYRWINHIINTLPENQWFTVQEIAGKAGYPIAMVGPACRRIAQQTENSETKCFIPNHTETKYQWMTEDDDDE